MNTQELWLYLMHSKLDVLQMIKNFVALIKNQFFANIQIVRRDNASDFFKYKCTNFFDTLGIIHQSSCPYTPQQNGTVEKNIDISLMWQDP